DAAAPAVIAGQLRAGRGGSAGCYSIAAGGAPAQSARDEPRIAASLWGAQLPGTVAGAASGAYGPGIGPPTGGPVVGAHCRLRGGAALCTARPRSQARFRADRE